MGGEFFREMGRKPYVIHGVLYSNSLWQDPGLAPARLDLPYLAQARWAPPVEPGTVAQGEWIFRLQCASCHTTGGYRDLASRTAAWTVPFGVRWLRTMNAQGVMPPFQGDRGDRAALAAFLVSLHGPRPTPADIAAASQGGDE